MTDPTREDDPPLKVVDRRWWAQPGATTEPAEAKTGASGYRPEKPTYVEELERALADRDRQLQDVIEKYRDASREFDEARARMRKDLGREVERGRRGFLAELLEVLDNLDRAVESGRTATSVEALLHGVELARRGFLAKLEALGVRRIETLGQPFDPQLHEAVTMVPTREPGQDGVVCGVLAEGYLIGDEVLRPARVAVGQIMS